MTTCALVGATYFNENDFMARYNEGFFDFIIAVDGGFAPLDRLGVAPDMAIGDFDSLGYLQLFAAYSERGFYVTGIAEGFAIRCVTGPDVFTLPDNVEKGTVSVFAANDRAEGVIERGLEYSLDDEPLTNRTSLGLSNELIGQEATIAVESGTLYVFYPLPWETSE